MTVIGIISEYNPMHLGHMRHIQNTRDAAGSDCAVVCVMSGNFVQRGDFAVFSKHARAEAAVRSGADLVIELPVPYVLSSSEGFAAAGISLLESVNADFISFGSETGDIKKLYKAAQMILSPEADMRITSELSKGISYASACQKAADSLLGEAAELFKTPNNLLGIEYIKALIKSGSSIRPLTFKRTGGEHDGMSGYSSSNIRRLMVKDKSVWHYMPEGAAFVYKREAEFGRGPVFLEHAEQAVLSRLRFADRSRFSSIPGASEGFYRRVMKAAASEPSFNAIAQKAKTKRYVMSRIRRMLLCVCLGITTEDSSVPPPYIKVLAMNKTGAQVLKRVKAESPVPVITKPSATRGLSDRAVALLEKEAAAADFYVLCYSGENNRAGGSEWKTSPYACV